MKSLSHLNTTFKNYDVVKVPKSGNIYIISNINDYACIITPIFCSDKEALSSGIAQLHVITNWINMGQTTKLEKLIYNIS